MMTHKEIEKELKRICFDRNLFFSHNPDCTGKILWYDAEEQAWCVNSYTTKPHLEVGSMPDEQFTR